MHFGFSFCNKNVINFFQSLFFTGIGSTIGASGVIILVGYIAIRITSSIKARLGICQCVYGRPGDIEQVEQIEIDDFNHTMETIVEVNEETPLDEEILPDEEPSTSSGRVATRLQTGKIEALSYTN